MLKLPKLIHIRCAERLSEPMKSSQFTLEPDNQELLSKLCGNLNENLNLIEKNLAVEISHRGNVFRIVGPKTSVGEAQAFIESTYRKQRPHRPSQDKFFRFPPDRCRN